MKRPPIRWSFHNKSRLNTPAFLFKVMRYLHLFRYDPLPLRRRIKQQYSNGDNGKRTGDCEWGYGSVGVRESS